MFLTADHGAAHAIGYMQNHDLPADYWDPKPLVLALNKALSQKFKTDSLVDDIMNYQVDFAAKKIEAHSLDVETVKR